MRKRRRSTTWFALLTFLLLALPVLCSAQQQPAPANSPPAAPETQPQPQAPAPAAPKPDVAPAAPDNPAPLPANNAGPGPFTPEKYYQLLLERQRLEISSDKQILVILDANGNDPLRAMNDLKKHEEERAAKQKMLFDKYGISPEVYYRSSRGSEEQAERAKYLSAHDEIRDELAANSKELKALEKEVWRRFTPAWTVAPKPK
jgi:hypothetical protein